jgi:hypothetical protein
MYGTGRRREGSFQLECSGRLIVTKAGRIVLSMKHHLRIKTKALYFYYDRILYIISGNLHRLHTLRIGHSFRIIMKHNT